MNPFDEGREGRKTKVRASLEPSGEFYPRNAKEFKPSTVPRWRIAKAILLEPLYRMRVLKRRRAN